jgi:predicted RNase H-like HicB family nuclease
MKRQMELRGDLPFELAKEGAWIVANCPVLNVASQGKTAKAAERNLRGAMHIFLRDCLESGTLEQVFRDAGLVQVELAGQICWIAKVPGKHRPFYNLKVRARAVSKEPLHRAPSRRVQLPTVLPWLIRADIHGQARAS